MTDEFKKKNCRVRFGRSLWSADQLPAQWVKNFPHAAHLFVQRVNLAGCSLFARQRPTELPAAGGLIG